jgi:hypothetical protein
VPSTLANYEKEYINRRKAARNLWEKSQEYFPRCGGECRTVRNRLGIHSEVAHKVWQQRGGQFVGGSDRKTIDLAVYGPEVGGDQKNRNLFKGHAKHLGSWREGVVLPFFDLPGRVSAVLVAASPPHSKLETRYVHLMPVDKLGHKPAGVTMPEALNLPPGEFGDKVLVCLDPLEALRMHVKHFATRSDTLPVVGIQGSEATPRMLMDAAGKSRLVLRAEKPGPDVFRHASELDGSVVFNASTEGMLEHLWRFTPRHRLAKLLGESVPWAQALEEHVTTLSNPEIDDLFLQLNLSPEALQQFLCGCRASVRSRLEEMEGGCFRARVVNYKHFPIRETSTAWTSWTRSNGFNTITDAPFHIDRIVYQPLAGKSYYQGRVWCKGQPVHFLAEKHDFEKHPMLWLHHHLIERNICVTRYNQWWQNEALHISMMFHKPELVRGVDSYGWDNHRAAFVLPAFSLVYGGRIETTPDVYSDSSTPARHLRPPEALNSIDLLALEKSNLAWAMILATLYNLLLPSYGRRAGGIALAGDGVRAAMTMARVMGCPEAECLDEYPNNWPVVISAKPPARAAFRKWLTLAQNCFVEVQDPDLSPLGTYPGWTTIRTTRQPPAPPELLEALAKVVPAFLHRVCLSKLPCGQKSNLWRLLVAEVNNWRNEMGLPDVIQSARRAIRPAESPGIAATHFGEVLVRLLESGGIDLINARFYTPKIASIDPHPRMAYFDDKLWIPKTGINNALGARKAMPVDIASVGKAFGELKVLVDEVDFRGSPGWVVKHEWWEHRQAYYRQNIKNLTKENPG